MNYSHPEIRKLIKELTDLKDIVSVRANTITNELYKHETDEERIIRLIKSRSAEDTYAYCIMRLQNLGRI
jgi:hypothetical protein